MSILIIDDEPGLRRSLAAHFEDLDLDTLEACNGLEGLEVLREHADSIEAVIVDLNMQVMDGASFIGHATQEAPEMPIIVLSGVGVIEDAIAAMRRGAWDFITKPLHSFEMLDHTLNRVFERARLLRENRMHRENLECLVRQRTEELEETRRQVMQRLSRAAEYKDNETGRHVIRVGQISRLLGAAMGLGTQQCDLLGECAPLHDVGKIGIPDEVLLKPGRLDDDELVIMRRHCLYGCEILGPLDDREAAHRICSDVPLLRDQQPFDELALARILALCHHERWDGGGYPFGLSGEDIPVEARIVSVVDVYDALCSDRPYKTAMPPDEAAILIRDGAGTQFDPAVVDAFLRHRTEIDAIRDRWRD